MRRDAVAKAAEEYETLRDSQDREDAALLEAVADQVEARKYREWEDWELQQAADHGSRVPPGRHRLLLRGRVDQGVSQSMMWTCAQGRRCKSMSPSHQGLRRPRWSRWWRDRRRVMRKQAVTQVKGRVEWWRQARQPREECRTQMARVESGRSRGAGGLTIVSMLSDFGEVLRPFVQRRLQDGTLNRPHTMCVRTLGGSK